MAWVEVTRVTRNGPQIIKSATSFPAEAVMQIDEMSSDSPPSLEIGANAAVTLHGGSWFHVTNTYQELMEQVRSSDFSS